MGIFVDFFNWIIEGIAAALSWLLDLMPDSPVNGFSNDTPVGVVLGHITWFIPFPTMLLHFSLILSAIIVYYAFRVVGRWIKLVRS